MRVVGGIKDVARKGAWRLWGALPVVWLCSLGAIAEADTYVVPNRYLVQRSAKVLPGVSASSANYIVVKPTKHFEVVVPAGRIGSLSLDGDFESELLHPDKVAADCAEILKDPSLTSCEPDVIIYPNAIPNDAHFSSQWYLHDPSGDGDVEMSTAWEKGMGVKEVLIGVLDTGVYWSHPDLVDNMWTNPGDPVDGVDNDGNGFVDDVRGVNTATGSSDPNDPHGHGTHVAGIIGGRGNNGAGISGVMWRVSLIAVSATNSTSGALTSTNLLEGLDYFYDLKVAGHNIRAVNASWGGGPYSGLMYDAIVRLNSVDILLICAAGNESRNNDTIPHYPSDYIVPNVVSVGATGPTRELASYSNYGSSVDIAAPGGDSAQGAGGSIYSTYRSSSPGQATYAYLEGTSMAAPVVTGAIGLLASQRPVYTGSELRSLLLSSADTVPALSSSIDQGRFLNVGAMSSAIDPYDECPDDSNKEAPGVCGCGVNDSVHDADSDGTFDCNESCPNDSGKTAPGVCGCGVSDIDANGNGTADCLDPPDQCPTDTLKDIPGVCGCGVSDDDLNANGTADCNDPKVVGIVPVAPTVKTGKGKAIASMTAMNGVGYAVKITTLAPKRKGKPKPKPKTVYVTTTTPSYALSRLKAKTKVTMSYAYVLSGTPLLASQYSPPRSVTVK